MNSLFRQKRLATLLTVSLAFLASPLLANAEDTDTSTGTDTESGSGTDSYTSTNYNKSFFENINYTWTENSVKKTANLSEIAKGWPQIQMFIQKIMDDTTIPGLINDPTPDDLKPTDGYIMSSSSGGDAYKDSETGQWIPDPKYSYPAGTQMAVNWKQKYNDWKLPTGVDRTPNEDSPTAIFVKLKNEFREKMATDDSTKVMIENSIESMQVMPNRLRIDNPENPGWLFNLRTSANKFFIMTKGKLRSTFHRPFNWMFELYSPADDSNLPCNVYDEMLENTTYAVLHDCKSIQTKYHPTRMGAVGNTKDYVASILFFLPDYRFAHVLDSQATLYDEEKDQYYCLNEQNKYNPKRYTGQDWTRDDYTSFIYYNPAYAPTMLFNTVDLYTDEVLINKDNSAIPEGYAWVELSWHSNISKILKGTDIQEQFQLYRIVDGKKVAVTLTATSDNSETSEGSSTAASDAIKDMIAKNPDLDTITSEDGNIILYHISKVTGWVYVYVLEEQDHGSRQVEYLVEGSIKDSEIPIVESNTVEATIPGQSILERCELNIIGKPTSQFVYQDVNGSEADYNHYVHKLGLTNKANSHYPLLAGHLKITDDIDQNTRFTLCRSTTLDDIVIDVASAEDATPDKVLEDHQLLALQRLYITGSEVNEDDGYTYFKGKIVDLHTGEILSENNIFKAKTEDGDNAILTGLGVDGDVWFTVTFDAATKDNQHPMLYCYRLFSNIPVTNSDAETTGYACSTVVEIEIPHTQVDTTFNGYTEEEIRNDAGDLSLSDKQVVYRPIDDVNVSSYMIIHNGLNPLAVVRRTQDGQYEQALYTDEEVAEMIQRGDGTLATEKDDEEDEPTIVEIGERRIEIVSSASKAGGDVVCEIFDFNGNSYGTGRVKVPDDIALTGKIRSLDRYTGTEYYLMFAEAQIGDTEDNKLYLVANDHFNAWTITGDGTQAASDDDIAWDSQQQILSLSNIIDGVSPTSYTQDSYYFDNDALELVFTHPYDTPTWNVGIENPETGTKPFAIDVKLRYYPEVIPVSVYDAYEDYTNSSSSSSVKRRENDAEKLYAVTELTMAFTTDGSTTISGVENVDADIPQQVTIYNIQGMVVARYQASGSDREILRASGLPAGNYVAVIGNRSLKAAIR